MAARGVPDGGNWTRHEDGLLCDYIAEGLTFAQAARRLMRRETHVKTRFAGIAAKLGEEI